MITLKTLRNCRGFTLIELMIVIAIIGILAAIAIAAYQDYTIRTKVSEGLRLASTAKAAVAETFDSEGTYGADNAAVGLPSASSIVGNYVSSVNVATSTITITYKDSGLGGNPTADGKTITLVVSSANAGSLTWDCTGGTQENKYRPSECRL